MTDEIDRRASQARAELSGLVKGEEWTPPSAATIHRRAVRRRRTQAALALTFLAGATSLAIRAGAPPDSKSTVLASRPTSGIDNSSQLDADTSGTTSTSGVAIRPSTSITLPARTVAEPSTTTTASQGGTATTSTTSPQTEPSDCGPGSVPSLPKPSTYALHRPVRTPGAIVYVAWTPGSVGQSALWIMAADGSDRHPLTDPSESNSSPDLSADGSRIVWIHDGEVVAMDAHGRITQLTDCPAIAHPDYGVARGFGGPKWSPDGSMIAVAEAGKYPQNVPGPQMDLLAMNADGTNQRYIEVGDKHVFINANVSWLPNGRQLLVSSSPPDNDPGGFFLVRLEGGPTERVYSGKGSGPEWWQNGDAALAPGSGDNIVYLDAGNIMTTKPAGPDHLIVDANELPPQARILSAIWSYDHTRIIFACRMGDDTEPGASVSLPENQQPDQELWSVALDGTDLRDLSNDSTLRQADPGTN